MKSMVTWATVTLQNQSCLSITKPIISFDNKTNHVFSVCHMIETIVFFTGKWDRKSVISQEVMNTPAAATWEKGLIC